MQIFIGEGHLSYHIPYDLAYTNLDNDFVLTGFQSQVTLGVVFIRTDLRRRIIRLHPRDGPHQLLVFVIREGCHSQLAVLLEHPFEGVVLEALPFVHLRVFPRRLLLL